MVKIVKMQNDDVNFYKDLGELITNKSVIKELGEPIITDSSQVWFVAYKDNKVIGFCSNYSRKDGFYIGYLYVVGSERGNGLGAKLLKKQIDFAKENKVDAINVVATMQYSKLFEKYGFQTIYEYVKYKKMRAELL